VGKAAASLTVFLGAGQNTGITEDGRGWKVEGHAKEKVLV